ncbi:hypothetical protein lerEdw1_020922, partial [Lerista edwardsae]
CEEPADINFGAIVSDEKVSYQEHDRIQYRCDPGYALEGSEWISCDGQRWTSPPKCLERGKNCSRPPPTENGDIITLLQKEYPSGSWVEFKCQRYYAMEGPNRSFCNNGTWTKVPACLEPCVIALPESHQVELKGRAYNTEFQTTYLPRGDSIEVSCKPRYILETNPSNSVFLIQCNGEPIVYPKCKEKPCRNLPKVPGRLVEGRIKTIYRAGETVTYVCHPAFGADGPLTVTCQRGEWTEPPPCEVATCPPPPSVEHGQLGSQQKERYLPFETVRYRCDAGWSLFGPQSVTCLNKQWTEMPQCRVAGERCGRPPVIENGDILEVAVSLYASNSVVNYKCQSYYVMRGQSAIRCINGHWTEAPACIGEVALYSLSWFFLIKEPCVIALAENQLIVVKGSSFDNRFQTTYLPRGDSVELSCKHRYVLETNPSQSAFLIQCNGERIVYPNCKGTCQKPAEWNELAVFFNTTKSIFFLDEKQVYECKDGYETIKKTTAIQCEVSVPDHMSILPRKDLYLHGDVVQFSCHRRFTRVGAASAQCYHFGWSPLFPSCKVQVTPCKPPPNITDGSIIDYVYDEYPHGEQVEYKCNIKFAMTGSKIVECIDGEWTSLPSCTVVVEKTCEPPPSIPSGYPVSRDGEKYSHGETITYECEENSVIVGTNPAQCLHGEWKLPACADDSVKCPRPKISRNANLVFAVPLKRQYDNNDMLSYSCSSNHHKTKCINGEWSPKPECRGKVLHVVDNKLALCTLIFLYLEKGGVVKCIECNERDLHSIGSFYTIKYTAFPDQRCGDPPVIANGESVNSIPRKYLPGESVEYRCHEGFEFRGSHSAICENMEWSQVPACEGTNASRV